MQGAEWARLSQPFSPEAFGWYVVEISGDSAQVRLAPYLSTTALSARLDAVAGPDGWSFQLAPLASAGDAAASLICNLSVAGVTRAAVAKADGLEPQVLAEVALSRCAELFGVSVPQAADGGWVDRDTDEGEPLFTPELVDAVAKDALYKDQDVVPTAMVEPTELTTPEPARRDGQVVIDRLLERLKEEGLGKAAAQLVVEHHGYGRTPEEARVLYGKLRGLLLEKTLVTP